MYSPHINLSNQLPAHTYVHAPLKNSSHLSVDLLNLAMLLKDTEVEV